ncbi:MAG: CvpA family protein [Pseudomonadota bacterium]
MEGVEGYTWGWPIAPGDVLVLLGLFISGIVAYTRGFSRELLSLAAWTGAIVTTAVAYQPVFSTLSGFITSDAVAQLITVLIGLVISLMVWTFAANVAAGVIQGVTVSAFDRTLGMIFGFVRGFLVIILIFIAAMWFFWPDEDERPQWVSEARLVPILDASSDLMKDWLGGELARADINLDILDIPKPENNEPGVLQRTGQRIRNVFSSDDEAQPETQPEPQSEPQPETQPEPQSEPQPEQQPESQATPQASPQPEPNPATPPAQAAPQPVPQGDPPTPATPATGQPLAPPSGG